ncbi:hypothetical protein GCM10027034_25060 [Ramlibacter solisilvae]|uniref:Flagellar assembly protein FliH n=1 Tax=Ramlibacter tataouinensis TaxID=94132 RepID=A0A127JQE1_9BURK|nr:FliH/SctL family protein [Ramlibacter tataouinensis]AMO22197.1 hypothetical protein UC35_03955 [Ramlibacter tataouinensis]
MRPKHLADKPAAAPVLRGVVLHAQPHALVRPGRMPIAPAAKTTVHPQPAPSAQAAVEAAFAEGRREGFAAGHSAGAGEERLKFDALIEEARARAREEGRQAGLQQGLDEAGQQLARARDDARAESLAVQRAAVARLECLLRSASAAVIQWRADGEEDLVALAHEALCRILGAQASQPETLKAMVRHLLAEHGRRSPLSAHVHPEDFAALASVSEPDGWQWVADEAVSFGGMILRSPQGGLDARLETQLAALGGALAAARAKRRPAQASYSDGGQAS